MAVAPKQKGLEVLRKLVPLNTLSEDDLHGLLDKVVFEKLKKGATLFREGDRDNHNIYLLSGRVALLSGRREVDTVDAGSDTARFPLAHQIPRKFSVVARSRAEVVRIDNRLLGELIARVGRISYEVSDLESESTDDWMSQLLQLRVFQQIPPENIQRVILGMEEIYLNQGDLVVEQGEQGQYFYLINTGYCSVACQTKEGAEPEEVARLGPGDTFGEEALLSDSPRACTVSMLTDGLLLTLKKEDFIRYVKEPLARELKYPQALAEVEKGSLWLDVRPSEVFEEHHLPNSLNLPLSSLRYQMSSLDPERSYIVYCSDGRQSNTAAYLLYGQGFHVSVLIGGVNTAAEQTAEQGDSGADIIRLRPEQESESQEQGGVSDAADPPSNETAVDSDPDLSGLKARLAYAERESEDQNSRVNQLKQALEKAKGRLESVENKRIEIEGKYQRLQEDAGQLRDALEQKEEALRSLQDQATQVEVLSTDKAVAESRLRELEREIARLKQAAEKAAKKEQETAARLTKSDADYKQQVKHQVEKEEALNKELAAADDMLQSLHLKLTELETSGAEQGQQIEALRETQAQSAKQVEQLQKEKDGVGRELSAARDQLAGLESQLSEQDRAAKQQEEHHQRELGTLQARIEEQQTQRTEARKRLASLTTEKEQSDRELAGVRDQLARLESKLSAQENAQYEQDNRLQRELADSRAEKDRLEQELNDARAKISELNLNLSAMESSGTEEEAGYQQELADLQRRLDEQQADAAQRLQTAEAERQALERELANSLEQQRSLQNELVTLKGSESEPGSRLQQEADALRSELEQARAQLGVAEGKLASLDPEADRLRKELESTGTELVAIKQVIGERDVQLGEQLQELSRLNAELDDQKRVSEQEIEALREELKEVAAGREAAEHEVKHQRGLVEAVKSGGGDVKALQAELETLTAALEESDKVYDEITQRVEEAQSERDREAARARELADELDALRQTMPESGPAPEVDRLRQEKESAEARTAQLKQELDQLQARIGQQEAASRQAQEETLGEEAALRSELQLVREQAESEVARLRGELEEAKQRLLVQAGSGDAESISVEERKELEELRLQVKEKELSGAAEVAENDALRTELTELQSQLAARKQELEQASVEQNRLFEEFEGRSGEIDRLKEALEIATVEGEEADFRREEAEAARKQVEEALYQAQQEIESQRARELVKGDFPVAPSEFREAAETHPRRSTNKGLKGALIGALLAFGVADGVSIMGGRGEIVSGLLGEERLQQVLDKARGVFSPADTPQSGGGERIEDAKPDSDRSGKERPEGDAKLSQIESKPRQSAGYASSSARPKSRRSNSSTEKGSSAPAVTRLRDRLPNGEPGPELVYIRGGSFSMGSDVAPFAPDEKPVHTVELKSFAIGQFEVTFDEYMEFAMATGRDVPPDEGWGRGRRPVINVSWEDALSYTMWLSEQTGRHYRLPTEAEWEYAATGGADTYYWWGFKLGEGRANCFNCGSQWDGVSTAPAGSFSANGYGLYSTAGNVMEWVADCYHNSYAGAPTDGSAWVDADCRDRVVRGGAFNKSGDALRAARRSRQDMQTRLAALGFRVVRDVN